MQYRLPWDWTPTSKHMFSCAYIMNSAYACLLFMKGTRRMHEVKRVSMSAHQFVSFPDFRKFWTRSDIRVLWQTFLKGNLFLLQSIQTLRSAYSSNLNLDVRKYVYKSTEFGSIASAFAIFNGLVKILKISQTKVFNILPYGICSATAKLYLIKLISEPTKTQNRK